MLNMMITIEGQEPDFLEAANLMIQENGRYCILLMDGTQREGPVSEIKFIHVEAVKEN